MSELLSPYVRFTRDEWSRLRAATPLTLSEADLDHLRGINEQISLDEVADVYLPLSRLLNLYVSASQGLHRVTDTFLRADERPEGRRRVSRRRAREPVGGSPAAKVPYVIAVAGSVAVGKSTTARILQALLGRWPDHPQVDLVTTDGFLLPNRELEERGLMDRKGFPESYDLRRLVRFLADVKSGEPEVVAPVYSHLTYDIVPGEEQVVRRPEIVILEGLSVLEARDGHAGHRAPALFVSDFFDFSIYVDADEENIEQWYVERFLALRESAFQDERSFFRHFAGLDEEDAVGVARDVWRTINGRNLREHILPTRERADLVLEKSADHSVRAVRLRKL